MISEHWLLFADRWLYLPSTNCFAANISKYPGVHCWWPAGNCRPAAAKPNLLLTDQELRCPWSLKMFKMIEEVVMVSKPETQGHALSALALQQGANANATTGAIRYIRLLGSTMGRLCTHTVLDAIEDCPMGQREKTPVSDQGRRRSMGEHSTL